MSEDGVQRRCAGIAYFSSWTYILLLLLFFSIGLFWWQGDWGGWGKTLVHPLLFWLLAAHLLRSVRALCRICLPNFSHFCAIVPGFVLIADGMVTPLCRINLCAKLHGICSAQHCAQLFNISKPHCWDLVQQSFWICVDCARRGRSISGDALSPIRVLS